MTIILSFTLIILGMTTFIIHKTSSYGYGATKVSAWEQGKQDALNNQYQLPENYSITQCQAYNQAYSDFHNRINS